MTKFPVVDAPPLDLKSKSILRISIDGQWTVSDFTTFFNNIGVLYKSLFLINRLFQMTIEFNTDPDVKEVKFISFEHSPLFHNIRLVREELEWHDLASLERQGRPISGIARLETLVVKRISFASPGSSDFLGVAGILKEICEMLRYYLPNKKDKGEVEIRRQQTIDLRIKNLKAVGFTDIEIRTMLLREDLHLQELDILIKKRKINNIEMIENK